MSHDEISTWQQRYRRSLMGVFGDPQELLVTGSGAWVTDSQGRRLLDMLGGIAVNALGHAHPQLVAAISEQSRTLGHVSNLFTSEPQLRLAERLLEVAEAPAGSTVFFANSGSEANEAALKAVLRHREETGKRRILALENSFHGRTLGALSLTHKPAFRDPFGPLISGIEFLSANDIAALEAAFAADDVAGLFCEPIQGEAGVRALDDQYLMRARQLTRDHNALLVLDEVQTGIGRTAEWFRFQGVDGDVTPDLMTLAKGLGAGVPIAALLAFGPEPSTLMGAGQHGTTFGGNPLAATAGYTTLQTIDAEGLLGNAERIGAHIGQRLAAWEPVAEVRQFGLHIGIDLAPASFHGTESPAKDLVTIARQDHQLIINATGDHTVRLAPPLNLAMEEAETFLTRFDAACKDLSP